MLLLRALILSLAIHFLLVLILDKGAPYFEPKKPDTTEIELVQTPAKPQTPAEKSKTKQIVRQSIAPAKELKEDDTDLARFLSADKQRVRKEMQAAASGMTQNRSASEAAKQIQQEAKKPQAKRQSKPDPRMATPKNFSPDGVDIAKNLREYSDQVQSQSAPAPSTVGEALPQDVSVGSFTALNTDRYVYYSFFARIEDLIRFRWENRVRNAVDNFDRNYLLSVVGQRNWLTSVDIWVTPQGRFHSAHILKESGIGKFDQAAVMAFKEAGLFPNPPQEMIEDDGFIHLKYTFSVTFNPSALVQQ